ncbi:hypothetical protein MMC25_004526 [Agyrium rufum]|nr:hypothetical protein [Agyrium rufum]
MTYVNKHSVLAIGITFIILGIIVVWTRFYVRRVKKISPGLDDWLCIPALILVIAECTIVIIGATTNTLGSHSPANLGLGAITYDGADQITLEELEFPFDLMQIVCLMTLKLVILFFYRRIFRGRAFNIASWILIGTVIAWAITFFIAILAACGTHVRANFQTLGILKEECVDTFVILICLAVFDVVVDLAIIILPLPLIWLLQMPTKQKIALTGTFLVGAMAIACGITRMAIFAELLGPALFSQSDIDGVSTGDSIGIISLLMFWGMCEMGVGMIAVCLPTLRPLFHGKTPESIMRSFREMLSLGSVGSKSKTYRSFTPREAHGRTESEISLADMKSGVSLVHANQYQAYATGPLATSQDGKHDVPDGGVMVDKKLIQTVETV